MFVAMPEGLNDAVVLGVRPTLAEAKALCREANKRAKAYVKATTGGERHAGFTAVGAAGRKGSTGNTQGVIACEKSN